MQTKTLISLGLYSALGAMLSFSGVNVVDNTVPFMIIVALVIAIDINSTIKS